MNDNLFQEKGGPQPILQEGSTPPSSGLTPPSKSFFSIFPKPVLYLLGLLILGLIIWLGFKIYKKGDTLSEVTLTYWGLWEPEPVMRGVISQFEEDHPGIKVNYQMHSPNDYKDRLQNALYSGQGPDLFRIHQTWVPLFNNQLEPVPQKVAESLGLESNYFPVVSKAVSYRGRFLALPLGVDTLALYYNKDLLTQAGAELPRTWWGLQNLAQKITQVDAEGRIKVAGAALGTANNVDHFSDILGLMIFQEGADPANPDEQVRKVLEYYALFATKFKVWDQNLPNSTTFFTSGKLGFYFAPSWRYFEIKKENPGLNFGIAKVPQLPESRQIDIDWEAAEAGEAELTNINWASFWVEGVSASSQHKEAAWEFLGYLASAQGLRQFNLAASQVRDFGEIYPLASLANELIPNPYLAPFVKQAETARFWYLCSATHDASLNDGMIKYYEDALNSLLIQGSSAQIVETLSAGVKQILNKYQLSE